MKLTRAQAAQALAQKIEEAAERIRSAASEKEAAYWLTRASAFAEAEKIFQRMDEYLD